MARKVVEPSKPAEPVELTTGQREKLEAIGNAMAFGGLRPGIGEKTLTQGEQRLVDLKLATFEAGRLKITEAGRAIVRADRTY